MHTRPARNPTCAARARGLSLIELMVALTLGLMVALGIGAIYLATKVSFKRQTQLSTLQQGARTAFELLARDTRMIGHRGCHTGRSTDFNNNLSSTSIGSAYELGLQGYDFKLADPKAYTLSSSAPANETDDTQWHSNAAGVLPNIPLAAISGEDSAKKALGLTPGSDVLVIRTVSGGPVRLAVDSDNVNKRLTLDKPGSRGKCSDGQAKMAGFCVNSHALVASCTHARVLSVASLNTTDGTLVADSLGTDPVYTAAATEVFPLQTVAYYVKRSSNNVTTSLYRTVFDGDNAAGLEQELIEGVESLQVRYGVDTTAPNPDGVIDGDYQTADQVGDWDRVVAVRMSLLLRTQDPVGGDLPLSGSGSVNGVIVSYPSTGQRYDRRIFTTTVAVRNRISYF